MEVRRPYIITMRNAVLCLLAMSCAFTGCDSGPKVAEVTGVVTLANGKPLELIHLEFWSENGPRSYAKTDDSGNFKLKLDTDAQLTGAVIGKHKVSCRDTWPSKDDVLTDGGEWVDNSKGKKARIHSKYSDYAASPLEYEVKAGEKNHFEIKLDAAPK
jgi:hypothetical protein